MMWQVRVGNVRSIAITADVWDDWVAVVVRKQDGSGPTRWRERDKRLVDIVRTPQVSVPEMVGTLYDVLTPGRKAWLTRWFGDDRMGVNNG